MSGGRERDSGVHDRTINETSSEEEDETRRNPLGNIAEAEEEEDNDNQVPAVAAENPIANPVAGNNNHDSDDDDDDNAMANNAVKPVN